jgi:transcriptional regulator with XRE-family HTH domain
MWRLCDAISLQAAEPCTLACRLRYGGAVTRATRTPVGRRLGLELRSLREQTGRTVVDIATQLSWSESKLSRIETAATGISDSDLDRLLDVYDVSDADRSRLSGLAGRVRRSARRTIYGEALPGVLETFIGLEAEATAISTYGAILVPGLLQTPEYAGAMMQATPTPEDDLARERLTARMGRQAVLARQPPPRLRVVIDEAVLLRPVGGPEVMRRQMLRLIEASEWPTTSIQVLPLAVGAHPAVAGPFAVLDFANVTIPTHVFSDGLTGGVLRNGSDDVQRYQDCFEALTRLALNEKDSVQVISDFASGKRTW